ncbi:MAG: zincin-like metallopeptidase domain-containing protein [Candidatus Bathyarchaeia archaeon]
MSQKIHANIVKRIIKSLEEGVIPWEKPWNSTFPYNAKTKKAYSGINTLLLMNVEGGPAFLTKKQGEELGGTLQAGARYELITFLGTHTKKDDDEKKSYSFLRYYKVYPVVAFEGLEEYQYQENTIEHKPIKEAEELISTLRPALRIDGIKACYVPITDVIRMPHPETFKSTQHYYATLFHEVGHWTGHKSRCDRDLSGQFGSEAYAREELIAEIASAFICASIGLEKTDRRINDQIIENTSAYCASWASALKEAKASLVTQAASKAYAAMQWIQEEQNANSNQTVSGNV